MNDIARLSELIDTRYAGSQAAFARAISRQPAQINQYLKGRRQLGIEVKMHIEDCLGVPGWFGLSNITPNVRFTLPSDGDVIEIAHALQALDEHLQALAPVLQDAGRDILRKSLAGTATVDDAVQALEAMAMTSKAMGNKKD